MSREETAPTADMDANADPEVEIAAVDVDEIVRQERVRAIFQARSDCRKTRRKAKELHREAQVNRRMDNDRGLRLFRDAVEGYVREVEPLFAQTDVGQDYWRNRHFGDILVAPSAQDIAGDTNGKRLPDGTRVTADPESRKIPVHGLNTLFQPDGKMSVELEIEVPSRRRGNRTELKEIAFSPELSMGVLDEMYSGVNSYLSEIGFEVEIGKAQQHTKFDDDLVDELREWREENL